MKLLNKIVKVYVSSNSSEMSDKVGFYTLGKLIKIKNVEPYKKGKFFIDKHYTIEPIDYKVDLFDVVKNLELFMCTFTKKYKTHKVKTYKL